MKLVVLNKGKSVSLVRIYTSVKDGSDFKPMRH